MNFANNKQPAPARLRHWLLGAVWLCYSIAVLAWLEADSALGKLLCRTY